jgi:hypothetical protein
LAANLLENIRNSVICDELVKFLAPYFHLSQKQIKAITEKNDNNPNAKFDADSDCNPNHDSDSDFD